MIITEELALNGGTPVRTGHWAPWPYFESDEIDAVTSVLSSGKVNYWTGDEVKLFEAEYAAYLGVEHTIALANGTVALELALKTLNIGPGDHVIVPSKTFIATASAVVAMGAIPIVADIDLVTQNVTSATLSAAITPQTKAVICVHLAGVSCDMDDLLAFTRHHNLHLIEDCAQAHGGRYKGKALGSFGIISAFSFCQDKIMTTGGEGGLIALNDTTLYKLAWSIKDHGKGYDRVYNSTHGPGFRWLHDRFGTNWRLTEMQAAIGRKQLGKLDTWVAARNANEAAYRQALLPFSRAISVTPSSPDWEGAAYKFYFFVNPNALAADWSRDQIIAALNAEGIPTFGGSCSEIYLEKAFDQFSPIGPLPNAQVLSQTSVMLTVHPTLTPQHISDACNALSKVLSVAVKPR